MEYLEKSCEEKCPKCNSANIAWHDSELQDNMVIYKATCNDCNTDFTEEYKLVYAVTQYEK